MSNLFNRVLLLLALLFPCAAAWAEPTTFGVKPPGIVLNGKPGTSVPGNFMLENTGKKSNTYTFTLSGFVQIPNKGQIQKPLSALPPTHVARLIRLDSKTVTLPARSTKIIRFTVDLPPTFSGTEYAALTVSQGTTATEEETQQRSTEYQKSVGMGVQTAITLRVVISSTGEGASYAFKVDSITVHGATATKPLGATVQISNAGNMEMRIDPILILLGPTGNAVGRMKVDRSVTIEPGSKATVEFSSVGSTVTSGTYKAIMSVPNPQYQLKPFETMVTVK